MTPHLQEFIHRFEVGEGARWVRGGVALLALMVVAGLYLLFEYQNLSRPAAMDAAQVARQIARGEGFTTRFIRPLSVQMLEKRSAALGEPVEDSGRLHQLHPDLANPPLYPLVLALVMKVARPDYQIASLGQFSVYAPDRLVVLVNLGLLLALAGVTFELTRRLFDGFVASLSTLATVGAELPWRVAATGEATTLATLLVLCLAACLMAYDAAARNPDSSAARTFWLAALAGVCTGLAGLTAYGLLALAIPVGVVLLPGLPGRRWSALAIALVALTLTVAPWLARNYHLSGHCFGTASAAFLRDSAEFPADTLERSLTSEATPGMWGQRLSASPARLGRVLQEDLPRAGGSWIASFFLVGLLFKFSHPSRNVLRGFTLVAISALLPLQVILGPGAAEKSVLPGTDYLAVLGPLILVLGTAFFASLVEHVDWPVEGIRGLVISGFCLVAIAPLALMLLPPGRNARTFPPYHPPLIQQISDWVEPEELVMSDIPWAVAWYGNRSSLWLTQETFEPGNREDVYAVVGYRAKLAGLYLSQLTTEADFYSTMFLPSRKREAQAPAGTIDAFPSESSGLNTVGWPEFVQRSLTEGWLPPGFPLSSAHSGFLNWGQMLVLDSPRWNRESQASEGSESGVAGRQKIVSQTPSDNP